MLTFKANRKPDLFTVPANSVFPNNFLPVVVYRRILAVPFLFPYGHVKKLFASNNWANAWRGGIFTYHHYHSNTHEVLAVIKGETTVMLGGDNGLILTIATNDVIILPAGVAHKNLEEENQITCVGAYPEAIQYDMNYGKPNERPQTDENIRNTAIPMADPVLGLSKGIAIWWTSNRRK